MYSVIIDWTVFPKLLCYRIYGFPLPPDIRLADIKVDPFRQFVICLPFRQKFRIRK